MKTKKVKSVKSYDTVVVKNIVNKKMNKYEFCSHIEVTCAMNQKRMSNGQDKTKLINQLKLNASCH